jgi:short subunit dehydrogenase-like uncharacterized protein
MNKQIKEPNRRWMIYGANGYTGQLIAQQAIKRGFRPLLAGRNEQQINQMASNMHLQSRCFDLSDPNGAAEALQGVATVLNCAGPFSATAEPMIQACLASGTNYLDITGEIEVFELAKTLDEAARKAGCVLIPGVGFDVVATDCLALALSQQLNSSPDLLEMAFCGEGGTSPGTAKTFVELLPGGGRVRIKGQIKKVPAAWKRKRIQFSDRREWCMSIPWGDISTAYTSTHIPNIIIYTAVPRFSALLCRLASPLMPLLGLSFIQKKLKRMVEEKVQGPNQQTRAQGSMRLWGKISSGKKQQAELFLDVAEGYEFTAHAALAVVESLHNAPPVPGYHTPASAFGTQLLKKIPGCRLRKKNSPPAKK